MSIRSFLSAIEPESIPFPFSRIYSRFSSSRVFTDFYEDVAGQVAEKVRSGKVLDVGTGPGRLPIIIASGNPDIHVIGIDLSPDMITIASRAALEKGVRNVDFKVGNASELPFPDREFDLVISTLSFHHWKNPGGALDEMYRVLRENGEAWIYDIPSRIDRATFRQLQRKYGYFKILLLRLHSFTEPFYDRDEFERVANNSKFRKHRIDYKGITYKLRLCK